MNKNEQRAWYAWLNTLNQKELEFFEPLCRQYGTEAATRIMQEKQKHTEVIQKITDLECPYCRKRTGYDNDRNCDYCSAPRPGIEN